VWKYKEKRTDRCNPNLIHNNIERLIRAVSTGAGPSGECHGSDTGVCRCCEERGGESNGGLHGVECDVAKDYEDKTR
jgi:hypothetical protein